ncbi:MAG: hypothetical protein UZ14_CFX002003156 [Chloroflexi bacterium OLB14]|nr:MAG: hypothetical protein UZ14_CFX002003156 [Chloroflexi bacterium OLB14]
MNAPVQQKAFSRDFFDRQDPTEGIGELIIPFSFSSIYDEIDKDSKLSEICAELYDKVLAKLKSGDLGKDVQVDVIDYKDAKQGGKESSRKYLAITRETNRKTRITILARFLPYGNKLYVGVDSFVLGNTNWLKIIGTIALTLSPFVCYLFTVLPAIIQGMVASLNPFGGGGYQSDTFGQTFLLILQYTCCCIFPWLIFAVMFLWLNTVRNSRHEGNLLLGLRQSFNQILNTRSFNIDDILMTLKSVLPLILSSIREVFEKHDLPVKSLDEFTATIQTINNIQNVYGSGNAVAGAGGKASVSRPK